MSSIVSRRPPFWGSVSHRNERRWISMRFGTSTDLFRRAKVRRVRRASTAAKDDSFRGRETGKSGRKRATSKDSTEHRRPQVGQPALTDPTPDHRVCGAVSVASGGCDYRPACRILPEICRFWENQRSRLRISEKADAPRARGGHRICKPSHPKQEATLNLGVTHTGVPFREPPGPTSADPTQRKILTRATWTPECGSELLQLDAASGLLEFGLELVGLLALDALLDRLGGLVH